MSNNSNNLKGKVTVVKDGEGKKFLKMFFTGNFKEAIKYAFDNVVVPYTKDTICRTSTNIVNYWVNGDKAATPKTGPERISYWQGYQQPKTVQSQIKANNVYSVGTLYFEDRGDAEAILLRMRENLAKYGIATVADLYDLAGEKFSFTDYNYGWKNLETAYVGRTNDGNYVIELPKAVPLK